MSRGSNLKLFVNNKIGGLTCGLHEMYIENHKDDIFGEGNSHPRFYTKYDIYGRDLRDIDYPVDWDIIDSQTGNTYTSVLDFSFNSEFRGLIEEFNMNSYNPEKSSIVITEEIAIPMLKAIDYLLLKKYDVDIEEVMDNKYIDIFGTMLKEYNSYKYRIMFPNDDEYMEETEDNKNILIDFRTALRAFLDTEDNKNLLLLYESWG